MAGNNGKWLTGKWEDFEGFVEGVIYDRDLSVSARLFGLFFQPFSTKKRAKINEETSEN